MTDAGPEAVSDSATRPEAYADEARAVSPADRVVTVLLLVGLAVLVPIAGFMGLLTSMASDGCMANACNADLMSVGIFTSALSPAVVFLGRSPGWSSGGVVVARPGGSRSSQWWQAPWSGSVAR